MFEELSNEELIEKWELLNVDLIVFMREYYLRLGRRDLNNDECNKFKAVIEKTVVVLIDMLPPRVEQKAVEDVVKTSVSNLIKKAYSPNR